MSLPNFVLNRLQRMYVAPQTDPLTLPASITGTNFCLFSKLTLDPVIAGIKRPDITGSRTELPAVRGRMTGNWSTEMSLAGNGAAGVAPDCDPILQGVFGAAPTISASTSVSYALTDNISTFALYRFRRTANGGTGATNHIGMGCTVKDATFSLGSDIATFQASGESVFVLDSDNFGNYQSQWKGGLTSFPAEPSTPTYHGTPVIGFTGSITVDGQNIVELKSGTVKISTGNEIVKDTFGYYIGSGVEGDIRTVSVSLVLDDNDGSAIQDLKQKAFAFTPVDITMQVGNVAGNTWTFNIKQVQLAGAKFNDGQRRVRLEFGDSVAHGTTLSGLDSVQLVIT